MITPVQNNELAHKGWRRGTIQPLASPVNFMSSPHHHIAPSDVHVCICRRPVNVHVWAKHGVSIFSNQSITSKSCHFIFLEYKIVNDIKNGRGADFKKCCVTLLLSKRGQLAPGGFSSTARKALKLRTPNLLTFPISSFRFFCCSLKIIIGGNPIQGRCAHKNNITSQWQGQGPRNFDFL